MARPVFEAGGLDSYTSPGGAPVWKAQIRLIFEPGQFEPGRVVSLWADGFESRPAALRYQRQLVLAGNS